MDFAKKFVTYTAKGIQSSITHTYDSILYLSDVALLRSTPFKDCRLYDVQSFHLSCSCDRFDPTENYIGILIYQVRDSSDVFINGRHIKAGYVYIKQAKNIVHLPGDTYHAKCMRSLLDDQCNVPLIASGFAYQNGRWKCNSSTFNERFIREAFADNWKPEFNEKIRELGNYEKCSLSRVMKKYMENDFPSNTSIGRYSDIRNENLFS